jgi:hypothetical protein
VFSTRSVGGGLGNFIFGDFEVILGDFENWGKLLSSSYVCMYVCMYTYTYMGWFLTVDFHT